MIWTHAMTKHYAQERNVTFVSLHPGIITVRTFMFGGALVLTKKATL
jgi:hypothetical protein